MTDIACKGVHKYYGANHVLKGVSFEIFEGEKVGLLGKNGAGKTTLLKILSGEEAFDAGQVIIPKDRNMEVLDQIPTFPKEYTVQDVLNTAFEKLYAISDEMKRLEAEMSVRPEVSMVKKYGELQTKFEVMGGYLMETDLAKVCTGLLINTELLEKPFVKLSGGEQTRVNLARIILKKADILLLDEPTNHLDIKAAEWLEEYLKGFNGTAIVISHDRYFLDRVVTRIIEIENGLAVLYSGNYSKYVKEREERYQRQLSLYEKEQRKIRQLEEAAKRMHDWAGRADNKSMHRRAFAIEKRIERLNQTEKPIRDRGIWAKFQEKDFSGKDIVILQGIGKSFGDREILKDISLTVKRGDRIAVLGPNGCGKTTLLNIIVNKLSPDRGTVRIGRSVKYAFLPQIIRFENSDWNMLETVRYIMEWSEETARNRLAAFHFTGEEVFKPVLSLSGGERSRLKLFLLMQNEINLLILDEPTNHLDIASREWIEQAVKAFGGTLLFVSHDRYFISQFANRIWDLEYGQVTDYYGTYEQYRQWKQTTAGTEPDHKARTVASCKKPSAPNKKARPKNIARSIEAIEQEIIKLESIMQEIDEKMDEESTNYELLQELFEERERIKRQTSELYEIYYSAETFE
jgi:ATP-binding cassette subfamily F protein 3